MRTIKYNLHRKLTLECGKYQLPLGKKTYIMGILNVTPDSFSDGGRFVYVDEAVKHAKEMVEQGADIIDIGGESTRPGHVAVDEKEELNRVIPVIERLIQEIDVPISIDTYKANVAKKALELGVHMVNDIWGLQKDEKMAHVVSEYDVPIIIMHNKNEPIYKKDIIEEMCDFFQKSIAIALSAGIKRKKIILDPGIGFGKTLDQNLEVMSRLGEFNDLGYPILLGTSRKSLIGKTLNLPPDERLEGTLATTTMGIIQGVDIIRVHDVKENKRVVQFTDLIVRGE